MTEQQETALALARTMLADAEQFHFASAPLPLAQLRVLIALAERGSAPSDHERGEIG